MKKEVEEKNESYIVKQKKETKEETKEEMKQRNERVISLSDRKKKTSKGQKRRRSRDMTEE